MLAPYKRHYPGLIAGTNAKATERKGQWVCESTAVDERGHDYAPDVEYGTKPHEIPNNPYWGWMGRTHPGAHGSGGQATKGYFSRAIEHTKEEIKGVAEEKVNQSIKESGLK